jgi:hypothetical protein
MACKTNRYGVAALMQAALIVAVAAIALRADFLLVLGALVEFAAIISLARQTIRPAAQRTPRSSPLESAAS